jgi:hypothetical protein
MIDKVTMKVGDGAEHDITVRLNQLAMPGAFREMDEHFEMVTDAVRDMAGSLVDRGLTAQVSSSIEIAGQFATPDGVLMDSVVKISMKAKPAKVE